MAIAEELMKQLNQLPLEFQKKILEFARALNSMAPKGEQGENVQRVAGSIDKDGFKVMEEVVEYEKTKFNSNLERIEQEVNGLSLQDQLELIKKMIDHIKEADLQQNDADFSWDQFYGISKGLWQEDAQLYVEHLREER